MSDGPLYLATPPVFDAADLAARLDTALGGGLVSCVRLALATADEGEWQSTAAALHEVTAAHDIALVITDHYRLVAPLGIDGVHLSDQRTPLREVRKALGPDRIVGAFAGVSRHQGMALAEAGADYVSFGPVGDTGALGGEARADYDLFHWWSEVIEIPLVAEGAVGIEEARNLAGLADFIVPDPSVWRADDIAAALSDYASALKPS